MNEEENFDLAQRIYKKRDQLNGLIKVALKQGLRVEVRSIATQNDAGVFVSVMKEYGRFKG